VARKRVRRHSTSRERARGRAERVLDAAHALDERSRQLGPERREQDPGAGLEEERVPKRGLHGAAGRALAKLDVPASSARARIGSAGVAVLRALLSFGPGRSGSAALRVVGGAFRCAHGAGALVLGHASAVDREVDAAAAHADVVRAGEAVVAGDRDPGAPPGVATVVPRAAVVVAARRPARGRVDTGLVPALVLRARVMVVAAEQGVREAEVLRLPRGGRAEAEDERQQ
jgi:hypothetical protein